MGEAHDEGSCQVYMHVQMYLQPSTRTSFHVILTAAQAAGQIDTVIEFGLDYLLLMSTASS